MKSSASFGWQTSLADLSLILFMLSAAALYNRPAAKPAEKPAPQAPPAARTDGRMGAASQQSEPVAVYEVQPGAPPLAAWLHQQAADPRQQLTITAQYGPAPGAREEALRQATRLLAQAGEAGRAARLVVEPGSGPARVVLAYDAPGGSGPVRGDARGDDVRVDDVRSNQGNLARDLR